LSLTLELSRHWESPIARHCDRHRYAGVDPAETDLPAALIAALENVGAGETASHQDLNCRVIAVTGEEATGYLPLVFALKNATPRQADFSPLAHLAEPYPRPHADDAAFYATPRLVDHLDTAALAAWREFTARFVKPQQHVLDLMTSGNSHLDTAPARLIGLGMNAQELAANPILTEGIVHDLNRDPALPFADAEFDIVLCALSIEYLSCPEAVLRDVKRVLKPGGHCVISFSERWFPPKAVLPWPDLHPFTRVAWVLRHLHRAGFANLHTESLRGLPRPADDKYIRQVNTADPLYAVWGTH